LHMAFNLPYVYDYITKFCRQQAEVIWNHENEHVCSIEQGEARHRKYKRLTLSSGELYDRSMTKLPLQQKISRIGMICFAKPVLTEDFHIVQKEKFSITCHMCDTCTWRKAKHIHKTQTHSIVREGVT
jgi:hypothetical protein